RISYARSPRLITSGGTGVGTEADDSPDCRPRPKSLTWPRFSSSNAHSRRAGNMAERKRKRTTTDRRFEEQLQTTVIAPPLLEEFKKKKDYYDVIIDVNLDYYLGRTDAQDQVIAMLERELKVGPKHLQKDPEGIGVDLGKGQRSRQYVFAT